MSAKIDELIVQLMGGSSLGGLDEAQALRTLLLATSVSSPAIMPSSHSGPVGTGVVAGVAQPGPSVAVGVKSLVMVAPLGNCPITQLPPVHTFAVNVPKPS